MKRTIVGILVFVVMLLGFVALGSYTDMYIFKPSYTELAGLKYIAVTSDSRIKAKDQSDTIHTVSWIGKPAATFTAADTTPSVNMGELFKTNSAACRIADFDDGVTGQAIYVITAAANTFVSNSNLFVGSADIVTASDDLFVFIYDGSNWHMVSQKDESGDLSTY